MRFFNPGIILLLLAALCEAKIPAAVFNLSADSTEYILIVDKQRQTLLVVQSPQPQTLKIVREFRVTTGKEVGDKLREGDQRTPEGIYYIIGKIPGKKLTPKYGPVAFVLDYPNFADKLEGRNGKNIWIHGRDEAIRDRITEGCISLDNGNLLQLSNYIQLQKTPVIIYDDLNSKWMLDEPAYQQAQQQWQKYIDGWTNAWKEGQIDQYVDYYASNFRDEGGRDRRQFRAYKAALEERYAWKDVRVEKVLVLTSQQETHIRFIQKYQSPTFYSEGWKKLILTPSPAGWKISYEKFNPIRPRQSTAEFVENFIRRWIKAWENKDLTSYLTCYAPDFRSDGYDLNGWRKYKADLFASLGQIKVEYSRLSIQNPKPFTYEVTFRQSYQADGYRDVGIKTLTLAGPADKLQIIREEWKKAE